MLLVVVVVLQTFINWIIHENIRIHITSLVLHNKHHLHFWTSHREWLIALRMYWLVFEPIINRHLVPNHTASPLSIHSAHLSQIQVKHNCRNPCNYIHMIWLYYFNISGWGLIFLCTEGTFFLLGASLLLFYFLWASNQPPPLNE